MERESFIFYRSFYEAIKRVPKDVQAEIYPAITEYALMGTMPSDISPVAMAMFMLIQPNIDVNNKRFENGKKGASYGKRGGRPPKKMVTGYTLTFEQEIDQMKADAEWSVTVCKDYGLTPADYSEHLNRFLEHCRKIRNGKLHDSFDDAKSHLRYWLDKGGRRTNQSKPDSTVDNIPPDYDFDGGFGGQDI